MFSTWADRLQLAMLQTSCIDASCLEVLSYALHSLSLLPALQTRMVQKWKCTRLEMSRHPCAPAYMGSLWSFDALTSAWIVNFATWNDTVNSNAVDCQRFFLVVEKGKCEPNQLNHPCLKWRWHSINTFWRQPKEFILLPKARMYPSVY